MNFRNKKRRVIQEPPTPKPCYIVEVASGKKVYIENGQIRYEDKNYPSRQKAHQALQPVIKNLPKRASKEEPKKYEIQDV
jgi:hypothetical protein